MLAPGDRKRLRDVGFLGFEIEAYAKSPTLHDLNNDQWQTVMRNRKDWMMAMIDEGAVKEDIEEAIEHWYGQSTKRSPWDWIRSVGSPIGKSTRIRDYNAALAARRRTRALGKSTGVNYRGTSQKVRVTW